MVHHKENTSATLKTKKNIPCLRCITKKIDKCKIQKDKDQTSDLLHEINRIFEQNNDNSNECQCPTSY